MWIGKGGFFDRVGAKRREKGFRLRCQDRQASLNLLAIAWHLSLALPGKCAVGHQSHGRVCLVLSWSSTGGKPGKSTKQNLTKAKKLGLFSCFLLGFSSYL